MQKLVYPQAPFVRSSVVVVNSISFDALFIIVVVRVLMLEDLLRNLNTEPTREKNRHQNVKCKFIHAISPCFVCDRKSCECWFAIFLHKCLWQRMVKSVHFSSSAILLGHLFNLNLVHLSVCKLNWIATGSMASWDEFSLNVKAPIPLLIPMTTKTNEI